jgi:rod shape-determining protein MreC
LEIENQQLRAAGAENAELRRILSLPPWQESRVRAAEVLALAGQPVPTSATLSAGRRQGVKEGDVVVTDEGLLGRVGEVYGGSSRAILITDPNSAVACEVESTGVLGVLRHLSAPSPRLVLTGVPLADTVLVGQRVLTSGMSRLYPRGIPVGVVTQAGGAPGSLTQDIELAPAASLSRLRHAFVLSLPAAGGAKP